jgi:hypothetical protein
MPSAIEPQYDSLWYVPASTALAIWTYFGPQFQIGLVRTVSPTNLLMSES